MASAPDISFVIPVYNKADVLPAVVRALAAQQPAPQAEYIFVDDASTDGSVALLQGLATQLPGMTVMTNDRNAGPSIRLNQGAAAARGRHLCLIDADELIAPDAVAVMLALMERTGAQMVHGKIRDAERPAADLTPAPVGGTPDFAVLDAPLADILAGRGFVRMSWLVETSVFHAAGGCDPRIFIQDESLPLRLAAAARRMVDLRATTGYAPAAASRLSTDKVQQHHDRFFAAYNLLRDRPDLPAGIRAALRRRCLSAAWKALRAGLLGDVRLGILLGYAGAKAGLAPPSDATLARIAIAFTALDGVRRVPVPSEKAIA
ncbi:glycosyltransferase family 2 protein [Ferrovibrio xuzhouensis]|uniref:Glycosyltransferase family 2 protein n=1 Tax=Ferrovibrio xuzhouensis TaxID=1576914 RepID=A0ABV7VKY2_9PROT